MTMRTDKGRKANERLRAVMDEAGCSNTGLARRVNVCGAEHGLDLRYDKTSVARWLRGQQPRGRVPAVIAEALERKLGRPVSVDDIGMATESGVPTVAGLRFESAWPEVLRQVCTLWRQDAVDAASLSRQRLAVSVLVQPSRDWLIADRDLAIARQGLPAVGEGDTTAVRATTAALADLDHRHGGHHVRPLAVSYLDGVVSGFLTGSYGEASGRLLAGAAARLTELAGYMADDTGRPGLAQRYYIQALRLAHAADDRAFGAYVLASGMSQTALALGNPTEAVQLTRVAREGARGSCPAAVEALSYASEARGHAMLADAGASDRAAARALEAMERAASAQDADPAVAVDLSRVAEELAWCSLDLDRSATAAKWAREALQSCPPDRTRRRTLRQLLVASVQLRLGDVDTGWDMARRAVEGLDSLRSSQCDEALDTFRDRLRGLGRTEQAESLRAPHERNVLAAERPPLAAPPAPRSYGSSGQHRNDQRICAPRPPAPREHRAPA
ncbi:tetratricopeptide repeat protein [Streptomyces sp. NPDC057798]|uniref:tetratricopeptide repeat protein n=1 Tax=Streptomyces sp. NPDC057798 TaxID=3346252 RepID=UPI0036A0CA03